MSASTQPHDNDETDDDDAPPVTQTSTPHHSSAHAHDPNDDDQEDDVDNPANTTTTTDAVAVAVAGPVTLEKLLDYLLAAKRSLAATDQVWRANSIVQSAREALVESVELRARSGFLRDGIAGQLAILARVKIGVENLAWKGRTEFEATLRDLDDTAARLQATVDLLKSTLVESTLRPTEPEQRTLYDFIDGDGMEKLKAELKNSIDRTQEAHHGLIKSIEQFDDDIQGVKRSLDATYAQSIGADGLDTSLPAILRSLESQAKETAELLESLVRHFDLCVTALRHTEGGGAAARNITQDMAMDIHVDRADHSMPVEPISDEDRQEMLNVLTKDAAELDDVVLEIRDRLAEMEAQSEDLTCQLNLQATAHAGASRAFSQLEEAGTRLPGYVQHGRDFLSKWEEQKQLIAERMEQLEHLREFYENYLAAYDGLLLEVERRKETRAALELTVRKATAKMNHLYEVDLAAREAFRQDQGDFLPAEIWSGLMDPPVRFEISSIGTESEQIPEIPRAILEQAARRQNRRL